jgi:hypothetical protein
VAAACALAMPTAAHAAGWSLQPALGGVQNDVGAPRAAMDDAGRVTLVWNLATGAANAVQGIQHTAGPGAWSAATTLSGGVTWDPQIDESGDGTAYAVWRWLDPSGKYRIQVSSKPPDGAWTPAETISPAGNNAYWPRIAISRAGFAAAVWSRFDSGVQVAETALRAPGRAWAAPKVVGTDVDADPLQSPRIGIDAAGNADIIWRNISGTVQTAYARSDSFIFGDAPIRSIQSGETLLYPRIAVSENGNAVSAWTDQFAGVKQTEAATRAGFGDWELAGTGLETHGAAIGAPDVVADAQGDVVAAWVEQFQGRSVVRAAVKPAGTDWQPSRLVSDVGDDAASPVLAVSPSGRAYVAWVANGSTIRVASLADVRSAQPWSASVTVSPAGEPGGEPTVAASANGGAVVGWVAQRGGGKTIDASVLDVTPPAVSAGTPAGTAGAPIGFSATAADDWSGVAGASWDFGDGTGAPGLTAQHVYAQAGAYTATLRVSDGSGNVATTTRTVRVGGPVFVTVAGLRTIKPHWRQSRLKGSLRIALHTARSGRATVTMRTRAGRTVYRWPARTVRPGAPSLTLRLPATASPGRYTIVVALAGDTDAYPLTIAAPPEGVVRHAHIGGGAAGPPALTVRRVRELNAVFRFSALPRRGKRIVVAWRSTRPQGSSVKPRNATVRTYFKPLGGGYVPRGRWTCTLSAGGKVVTRDSVVER